MYQISVQIEGAELDTSYRHVHHAKTLLYLERARLEFLRAIGFSAEELIKRDLFPVIASIEIRYLREISTGSYTVTCEECRIEGRALKIHQRVLSPKGKVCVEAKVESMLLHGKTRRGVPPPEEFQKAFEAY